MLATRQVPVRYVYTRRRTSSALLLSGTTPLTTPSAHLPANNYITAASAKYYRHFFSLTSQKYPDPNVGQIILHRLGDWWGRAKKSLLRRPVESLHTAVGYRGTASSHAVDSNGSCVSYASPTRCRAELSLTPPPPASAASRVTSASLKTLQHHLRRVERTSTNFSQPSAPVPFLDRADTERHRWPEGRQTLSGQKNRDDFGEICVGRVTELLRSVAARMLPLLLSATLPRKTAWSLSLFRLPIFSQA